MEDKWKHVSLVSRKRGPRTLLSAGEVVESGKSVSTKNQGGLPGDPEPGAEDPQEEHAAALPEKIPGSAKKIVDGTQGTGPDEAQ